MPDRIPHSGGHPHPPTHVSQHTSAHTAARSEHTPSHGFAAQPASADPGSFPPPPAPEAPTALRVVVADDNPVVRAGLTVLLSGREDIEVVAEAADGRQAYEAAQRHHPDVVLLDVRMPGVDGISALPYLVRIAPVMMLTYSRESEIVREALRLGAGGYLVHGEFTADQLVAAVRDIKEGRPHFTHTAAGALLAHVRQDPGVGTPQPPLPDGLGGATASPLGDPNTYAYGNVPTATPATPSATRSQNAPYVAQHPSERHVHPEGVSQMQPDVAQSSSGWLRPNSVAVNREGFGLSSREAEIMDLIASGMNNQQIAATCFISEKTVKNHINRIFSKLHSTSRSEAAAKWLGTAPGQATGRG
ncbi:response regulator [Streptomyces sp. NPDC002004]